MSLYGGYDRDILCLRKGMWEVSIIFIRAFPLLHAWAYIYIFFIRLAMQVSRHRALRKCERDVENVVNFFNKRTAQLYFGVLIAWLSWLNILDLLEYLKQLE